MKQSRYTVSFTTGAELIQETIKIAELKLKYGKWNIVREKVVETNILQARTNSTLLKLYGEVKSRLQMLSEREISLLVSGTRQEQQQIVWLAICKRYLLIKDFTIEVIADHFDKGKYKLSRQEFDTFFNAKAEWHSNLDKVSASTRMKARQVIFKMLAACGLVNEVNEIMPQLLSDELLRLIDESDREIIRIYPRMVR